MPLRDFTLDKRNARFLGVCAGLAAYAGWDVTWVRVAAVVLTLTGVLSFLPLVYLAIALLAPAGPAANPGTF